MSASPSSEPTYEARLEAVLESVSEAFYALDADWRYVVFNRAAEGYFGVARAAMLGRTLWEVFPQGLGTPFEAFCRAAMNEGKATTFETSSALRPDRVVELRIVPMRGGGLAITLSDITERKSADARQRMLVNELNHRVKNSLATVQAIAAQSLRGPQVSPDARERFMARLFALAPPTTCWWPRPGWAPAWARWPPRWPGRMATASASPSAGPRCTWRRRPPRPWRLACTSWPPMPPSTGRSRRRRGGCR